MERWDFCCSILDYSDESNVFQAPVTIEPGLEINISPTWYRALYQAQGSRAFDNQDLRESGLAVVGHYDSTSSDPLEPKLADQQREIDDKVLLIPFAFWCAKATSFCGGRIVHHHLNSDGLPSTRIVRGAQLVPLPNEIGTTFTPEDVSKAVALFKSIAGLSADGTLRSAVRIVHKALTERMWDVRFALHWVALEALYGVTDKGELRFRLSTHIALYLGVDEGEKKALARNAKDLYDLRSKIVHGLKYSGISKEEAMSRCGEVEALVRRSLGKILHSQPDRERFDSTRREEVFNDLLFRG